MNGFLPLRTVLVLAFMLIVSQTVFAAHPLITDDTGTQGSGNFQFEINGEFAWDNEHEAGVTTKEHGGELAAALSYGITDSADLVLGIPYQWGEVKENGLKTGDASGIGDASLELKWRVIEQNGLSLALKPGITLPTGDEDKGLGTGRVTYSIFFITTKEAEPWAFHLNLGYIRNENKLGERADILHASLAGEVEAAENLKIVGNIGIESGPEKETNTLPAFVIAGIIYSLTEDLDLDIGIKGGLTSPETDLTLLYGLAFRF